MSNDVAYPVFRTPDPDPVPALALSTARRLMEFGRCEYSEVSVYAELPSVAEVRRMAKELPEGWFRGQEEHGEFDGVPPKEYPVLVVGVQGPGLPTDPTSYDRRLLNPQTAPKVTRSAPAERTREPPCPPSE